MSKDAETTVQIQKTVHVENNDLVNFLEDDGKVSMNEMITMATVIEEERLEKEIDILKKEKVKLDKVKSEIEKRFSTAYSEFVKGQFKSSEEKLEQLLKTSFEDQKYTVYDSSIKNDISLRSNDEKIIIVSTFGKKKEKNQYNNSSSNSVEFTTEVTVPSNILDIRKEYTDVNNQEKDLSDKMLSLIDKKSNMAKTERTMKAKATLAKIKKTEKGKELLETIQNMASGGSVLSIADQSKT